MRPTVGVLFFLALVSGCPGSTPEAPIDETPGGDTGSADAVAAETAAPTDGLQTGARTPAPDVLTASVARGRLFAPLGISTGGYAQSPNQDSPQSPFADLFQATTRILHPPRVQVIHLQRGEQRLILAQTDLIGLQGRMFERVCDKVLQQTDVDVHSALFLLANHTHSGPGHVFHALIAPQVTDTYNEAVFEHMTTRIADVVSKAILASPIPVRVGFHMAENAEMHADRRCENPDYQNDGMALMRLDRLDTESPRPLALVINYAMHGTVFSPEHAMLSGDAPRAVEAGVADALPAHTLVMFAQSWAGDMAPGNPKHLYKASALPSATPEELDRLDALGASAAQTVLAVWPDFVWLDNPTLLVRSEELPIDYAALAYTADDAFPHEAGAVLCGLGQSACDEPADMSVCLPLPPGEAPTQVRVSAARIGNYALVTLPGEPVTTLGESLLADVLTRTGADAALLFGYAQDYLGYLLLPHDWRAGGYEGGFNYWGPNQGIHLAAGAAAVAESVFAPDTPLPFEPMPLLPYAAGESVGYEPNTSTGFGAVETDLPSTVQAGSELVFEWTGGDPWVDSPSVALAVEGDEVFYPFALGNTLLNQDHAFVTVEMTPSPDWSAVASTRTFVWRARIRTAARTGDLVVVGRYRIEVNGEALSASGNIEPYTQHSSTVTIEPAPR